MWCAVRGAWCVVCAATWALGRQATTRAHLPISTDALQNKTYKESVRELKRRLKAAQHDQENSTTSRKKATNAAISVEKKASEVLLKQHAHWESQFKELNAIIKQQVISGPTPSLATTHHSPRFHPPLSPSPHRTPSVPQTVHSTRRMMRVKASLTGLQMNWSRYQYTVNPNLTPEPHPGRNLKSLKLTLISTLSTISPTSIKPDPRCRKNGLSSRTTWRRSNGTQRSVET